MLITIIIFALIFNGSEEAGGDEAFKSTSIALPHKTMQLAIDDETSIDLIYIRPGSFIMGRNTKFDRSTVGLLLQWDAAGAPYHDEGPSRKIKITKGFYVGKYEVTTRQFCKFLNSVPNPEDYVQLNEFARLEIKDEAYVPKLGCENCQINVVHWRGAAAFCKWLSRRTGLTIRLPTEAEWEYVVRNPKRKPHPYGETASELRSRVPEGKEKYPYLWSCAPVDAFVDDLAPDVVVGMPGWIGEWCSDFYGIRYLKDDLIDPQGPKEEDLPVDSGSSLIASVTGKYYVLRRGNKITNRTFDDEVRESGVYGFRIVVMPLDENDNCGADKASSGSM